MNPPTPSTSSTELDKQHVDDAVGLSTITTTTSLPSTPLEPSSPAVDFYTPQSHPASTPATGSVATPASETVETPIETRGDTFVEPDAETPQALTTPLKSPSPDLSLQTSNTPDTPDALALEFFHGTADIVPFEGYVGWLGNEGDFHKQTRQEFMKLFSFTGKSIVAGLRELCEKLYMKGEAQQLDRIMESFSRAWDQMNVNHGFGDRMIVYTIAYALLLLNTDFYAADHSTTKKISKSKFVSNTWETIENHVATLDAPRRKELVERTAHGKSAGMSQYSQHNRMSSFSYVSKEDTTLLVKESLAPLFSKEWQFQVESVLKVFYTSIAKDPLELHQANSTTTFTSNTAHSISTGSQGMSSTSSFTSYYSAAGSSLMPSVSLSPSLRQSSSNSLFGRLALSRLRTGGSSSNARPSFEQIIPTSSRRDSLNSMFSFESFGMGRHAVGFAGMLATSMIREDDGQSVDESAIGHTFGDFEKIEQELAKEVELELLGPPWAKEGLVRYKPYNKKRKDWMQVFAVVQRGQLKMFNFENNSNNNSSMGNSTPGAVVGSGNWMENANLVESFQLCHTIAQELPSTKKTRSGGYTALWSLTLPSHHAGSSGQVLLFQAGTKEIAKEYVHTCNYWAGRLSKEPFEEMVSSMEFGWTESILSHPENNLGLVEIKDWFPSTQSLIVSDLDEMHQLENLKTYLQKAEKQVAHHNELRSRIVQAFNTSLKTHSNTSAIRTNATKANTNWERKSQFLLNQFVRYRIYIENLEKALEEKRKRSTDLEVSIQADVGHEI